MTRAKIHDLELIQNRLGFSIVEVLVAVGIMGVLTLSILSLLNTQNRELRAIDEKMNLQSLQVAISASLSNPGFCSCFLGSQNFNYSAKTWDSLPTIMNSSFDTSCNPQGSPLLSVGVYHPGFRITPTAINVNGIVEVTANSGIFTANLSIQLDPTNLVRARKDLSFPFSFSVNMTDPPTARRLITCSAGSSSLDMSSLCSALGGIYDPGAVPPTPRCQITYQ
jgi:type II secretory pathway pseudopilin PulG